MAKQSSIAKNNKRRALADKSWKIRQALRQQAADTNASPQERWDAQVKLQKLPRNTSPCRVVNRCFLTGRPKGFLRKFGLSRIAVRELANQGMLPGVTKSSW